MISDTAFLEKLKASPAGQEIVKQSDQRRLDDRAQLVNALTELEAAYRREMPALVDRHEAALARAQESWTRWQADLAAAEIAGAERRSHSHRHSSRQNQLERQLTKTASPMIMEFRTWCVEELDATSKANSTSRISPRGLPRIQHVTTNSPSIKRRMSALVAAIQETEAMKLLPNDADVAERISALKRNLPILEVEEYELDTHPRVVRDGD